MTTTTTTSSVPLPAGAECRDEWQDSLPLAYRIINSPNRGVEGHNVTVWSTAVQWSNGIIDDGRVEAPSTSVDIDGWENGLTSAQARELAAVLLECADEIDGWTRRPPRNARRCRPSSAHRGATKATATQINSCGKTRRAGVQRLTSTCRSSLSSTIRTGCMCRGSARRRIGIGPGRCPASASTSTASGYRLTVAVTARSTTPYT
jgi:hypothetical protein